MSEEITYTRGSGNVFADLGLENAEEEMTKAQLARAIRRLIQRQGLTQTEAAQLLHTTQSRVSEIMGGKLDHFSVDRLLRFLTALHIPIDIILHESRAGQGEARVLVKTA